MTKLETLLELIDPDRTLDHFEGQADQALNSFSYCKAAVDSRPEFERILAELVCHVDNMGRKVKRPVFHEMDYVSARQAIINHYGADGVKIAFELSEQGVDGGFYGVLKSVAQETAQQYARSVIAHRIDTFLKDLSADQLMAVAQEYQKNSAIFCLPSFPRQAPAFWRFTLRPCYPNTPTC